MDEWVAITPNGSCLTAEQIKVFVSTDVYAYIMYPNSSLLGHYVSLRSAELGSQKSCHPLLCFLSPWLRSGVVGGASGRGQCCHGAWFLADESLCTARRTTPRTAKVRVQSPEVPEFKYHRPHRSEFTAVLQQFDMFQLEVCVYHDGRTLSKKTYSPPAKPAHNFFTTVIWNKWSVASLHYVIVMS